MNKNYKQGFKDASQINAAETRKLQQAVTLLQQEYNNNTWHRLFQKFYKKRDRKFDIKLVYLGRNDYPDKLRKLLCEQGHAAYAVPYEQYVNLPSNVADYIIYINDCDSINRKGEQILINQFGCLVSVKKNIVILSLDRNAVNSTNIDDFVNFYKSFISPYNEIEKINPKIDMDVSNNFTAETFNLMIDKITSVADDIERQYSFGLSLLYMALNFPRVLLAFGAAIPLAVTEELFKDFSYKLKSKLHRSKYVPICQQQIVELTLCNYLLNC